MSSGVDIETSSGSILILNSYSYLFANTRAHTFTYTLCLPWYLQVMSGVDIEPYSGFQGQESEAEVLQNEVYV